MTQRKIVSTVGVIAIIGMMLTLLIVSHHPTELTSVVETHTINSRLYIYGNDTQLQSEYAAHLEQKQIESDKEQEIYIQAKELQLVGLNFDSINIEETPLIDVVQNTIEPTEIPIVEATKEPNKYSKEDLKLLSQIIQNEAGSDFCTNEHQRAVASVVLNRVKSDEFPNTIKEVIYQTDPIQYVITSNFNNPTKRAIKNAKYILENGSILPDNCIWQSESKYQGDGVYISFETIISTTYICYSN